MGCALCVLTLCRCTPAHSSWQVDVTVHNNDCEALLRHLCQARVMLDFSGVHHVRRVHLARTSRRVESPVNGGIEI